MEKIFTVTNKAKAWKRLQEIGLKNYNSMPAEGYSSIDDFNRSISSEVPDIDYKDFNQGEHTFRNVKPRTRFDVESRISFNFANSFRSRYGENDENHKSYFVRCGEGFDEGLVMFITEKRFDKKYIGRFFLTFRVTESLNMLYTFQSGSMNVVNSFRTKSLETRVLISNVVMLIAFLVGFYIPINNYGITALSIASGIGVGAFVCFASIIFLNIISMLNFEIYTEPAVEQTGDDTERDFNKYDLKIRQWLDETSEEMQDFFHAAATAAILESDPVASDFEMRKTIKGKGFHKEMPGFTLIDLLD